MSISRNWKINIETAQSLSFWDEICLANLHKDINIPQLDKSKPLNVIDVGGNTGMFVEYLLNHTEYLLDRVVMFEPVPLYARWASFKHSNLLSKPLVQIVEAGLSDETGDCEIAVGNKDGNLGWNTMVPEWKEKCSDAIMRVHVFKFDDIVDTFKLDSIDLVKIDTEGWELNVMKGMFESIKKFMPVILVEIARGSNHFKIDELKSFLGELRSIGYEFTEDWPDETFDLVLVGTNK